MKISEQLYDRLITAYRRSYEDINPRDFRNLRGNFLKNLQRRCKKWRSARTEYELSVQRTGLIQLFCAMRKAEDILIKSFKSATPEEIQNSRRARELKDMWKILTDSVTDLAQKEAQIIDRSCSPEDTELFVERIERAPELLYEGSGILKIVTQAARQGRNVRVRQEIISLVQTDPTAEFPETRQMKRHFVIHIGPTNSGKTYESLQRLRRAEKGVYLSPLRLLALEVYDTLSQEGIPCTMITGEERFITPDSRVTSQTVETLDIMEDYDFAVIDECQMIADEERGHAWTRAILGIKSPQIALCASPDVQHLLINIIESCGDTCEVVRHERKTPLVMGNIMSLQILDLAKNATKGDCFIAFSKRDVLDMASRLELAGIKSSVIYGKLPPETRRREVEKFNAGKTKVVVATDAIGMGVNLPIRRIIFTRDTKFDGRNDRKLTPSEILQIAGRAGRFGKYNEGIITTSLPDFHRRLPKVLSSGLNPVMTARIGFPKVLLSMDEELDDILRSWESIHVEYPYKKMSIDIMLDLYKKLKLRTDDFRLIDGGDDKRVIYSMISCPFEEGNKKVLELWLHYCMTYTAAPTLEEPQMPDYSKGGRLEALETYYKMLDLYHLFSTAMHKDMDEKWLAAQKRETEKKIETMLSRNKKKNIKMCSRCGAMLPVGYKFTVCQKCYDGY